MTEKIVDAVVMLLPRFDSISNNFSDLMIRFNRYGMEISKQSGKKVPYIQLYCISEKQINKKDLEQLYPYVKFYHYDMSHFSVIKFTLKSYNLIKNHHYKKVQLIAGDIFFGNLVTIILNLLSKGKLKTQISIHGEIFSKPSQISSVRKWLKFIFIRKTLPHYDSIRTVSNYLRDDLCQVLDITPSKVIVAPIPLTIPPAIQSEKIPGSIIVVGRLHEERNLEEILEILDLLIPSGKLKLITFVGDGPLWSRVNKWAKFHEDSCRIVLMGKLSQGGVFEQISKHTILLSAAITEGFGMAIRESLILGTPVVARSNPGTLAMKGVFLEGIYLYSDLMSAFKYLEEHLETNSLFDKEILRKVQEEFDSKNLTQLVYNWLN